MSKTPRTFRNNVFEYLVNENNFSEEAASLIAAEAELWVSSYEAYKLRDIEFAMREAEPIIKRRSTPDDNPPDQEIRQHIVSILNTHEVYPAYVSPSIGKMLADKTYSSLVESLIEYVATFNGQSNVTDKQLDQILRDMVEDTVMFITKDLSMLLTMDAVIKIRRCHKDEILKNLPSAKQRIADLVLKEKNQ